MLYIYSNRASRSQTLLLQCLEEECNAVDPLASFRYGFPVFFWFCNFWSVFLFRYTVWQWHDGTA